MYSHLLPGLDGITLIALSHELLDHQLLLLVLDHKLSVALLLDEARLVGELVGLRLSKEMY